jgi:hypothetical protein
VHHSDIHRSCESPLTLANDLPDLLCQRGAVEISNRSRLENRIHGQGTLHAAVRPFWVLVMEVRAHDTESEVALHVLKERVAPEAASKGFLPREQERTSEECADGRARDSEPTRVANRLR